MMKKLMRGDKRDVFPAFEHSDHKATQTAIQRLDFLLTDRVRGQMFVVL